MCKYTIGKKCKDWFPMLIILISESWDCWMVLTFSFVWLDFLIFFFFYNEFGLDSYIINMIEKV